MASQQGSLSLSESAHASCPLPLNSASASSASSASTASTASSAPRRPRHRACDECRSRKLACSKEPDGCRRCRREHIDCVYSEQRPMGRPRKRQAPRENVSSVGSGEAGESAAVPDVDMGSLSFLMDQEGTPGSLFHILGLGDMTTDSAMLDESLAAGAEAAGAVETETADMGQAWNPLDATMGFANSFPGPTAPIDSHANSSFSFFLSSPASSLSLDTTCPSTSGSATSHSCGAPVAMNQQSLFLPSTSSCSTPCHFHPSPSTIPHVHHALENGDSSPATATATATATAAATASTSCHSLGPWMNAPSRPCTCFARLFLALDSLQQLPDEVDAAVRVAREATHVAHDTILCPSCSLPMYPKGWSRCRRLASFSSASSSTSTASSCTSSPPLSTPFVSPFASPAFAATAASLPPLPETPYQSFQNMMMMGALLPAIAHAYHRILVLVDTEVARATTESRRLRLDFDTFGGIWGSMAQNYYANETASSSGLNDTLVEPNTWRVIVRALLKADVYGLHGGVYGGEPRREGAPAVGGGETDEQEPHRPRPQCYIGLRDIVEMLETRSQLRHSYMDARMDAAPLIEKTPLEMMYQKPPPGHKHNCLVVIDMARREIQKLVI